MQHDFPEGDHIDTLNIYIVCVQREEAPASRRQSTFSQLMELMMLALRGDKVVLRLYWRLNVATCTLMSRSRC